jgi:hypothetical protein
LQLLDELHQLPLSTLPSPLLTFTDSGLCRHARACATRIAPRNPRPAWRDGWNDGCNGSCRKELPMKIKSKVKAGAEPKEN